MNTDKRRADARDAYAAPADDGHWVFRDGCADEGLEIYGPVIDGARKCIAFLPWSELSRRAGNAIVSAHNASQPVPVAQAVEPVVWMEVTPNATYFWPHSSIKDMGAFQALRGSMQPLYAASSRNETE